MSARNGEHCIPWRANLRTVKRRKQEDANEVYENDVEEICEKLNDAAFQAEGTKKSTYSK
jgi:hypothetical protein